MKIYVLFSKIASIKDNDVCHMIIILVKIYTWK